MTGSVDPGRNPNPEGISGINPDLLNNPCNSSSCTSDQDGFDSSKHFKSHKFDPIELMQVLLNDFWSSTTGLSFYCRISMTTDSTCTVQEPPTRLLWPVPPFRWRWTARTNPNPRQRKRRRFHETRAKLVNLLLCTLNWETLGCPKTPPSCARLGAPISDHQHRVIERIEALVTHFLHMPRFEGHELGRATGKFEGLIDSLKELPNTSVGSEDLFDILCHLHSSFDSYSSHFARSSNIFSQSQSHHDMSHPAQKEASVASGGTATVSMPSAKPVTAARVKWENPPSFDASEYLDPLVRAAFHDPETLRLPKDMWPASRPAKMHITRTEMLSLINRWDSLGACCLIPIESTRTFQKLLAFLRLIKMISLTDLL